MIKAIALCIIICIIYCVIDHKRQNTRDDLKALNDRVSAQSKQIDILANDIQAVNNVLHAAGFVIHDENGIHSASDTMQTFSPD